MSRNSGFTPPPIPASPEAVQGSSVRRHHTISSTSGRNGTRTSERRDSEEVAVEDDANSDQWTGGSPMAGEKQASLQRNLSLPSKYHRVSRDQPSTHSGSLTPSKAVGGLSSVDAGPEDEEWAGVANALYESEDVEGVPTSQTNPENMYSNSPPSAAAAVRRHVSMTDGQRVRNKTGSGLQRFPTVSSKPPKRSNTMNAPTETANEYPADYEEEEQPTQADEQGTFSPAEAYGGIQQNPWGSGGTETNWNTNADWRMNQQQQIGIDEVTNSLSNLELQQRQAQAQAPNYARGGPRFDMGASGQYTDYNQQLQQQALTQAQRMQLNTEVPAPGAPGSAPAYAPPIGHAPYGSNQRDSVASAGSGDKDHPRTAPGAEWEQKNRMLKSQGSNSGQNFHGQYNNAFGNAPLVPTQYMGMGQAGRHGNMGMTGGNFGGPNFVPAGVATQNNQNQQQQQLDPSMYIGSPIDVPSMISRKGYNPPTFDIRPALARYFVIKSYTEDDVHKSLKYEIWSSTDPGNKRLDKAFKESAGRGPIYLFFSVNASGHFCGMAEMLTPVDYSRSSTVWASDKWKGVFKVRWVFVRDIPNAVLRNIRLNNTQERKPVTNSRDTQELLPEAGHEMLRIFFTHPAKTSLLQDFAFYELQALQRQQQGLSSTTPIASPPPVQATLAGQGSSQHQYTMNNQLPYGQAQGGGNQQSLHSQVGIGPPITMLMGSAGHPGLHSPYGGQVALGIGPQIASSVLRGSSPGPIGSNLSGNMGYPGLNMNVGGNVGNQNSGPAGGGNF